MRHRSQCIRVGEAAAVAAGEEMLGNNKFLRNKFRRRQSNRHLRMKRLRSKWTYSLRDTLCTPREEEAAAVEVVAVEEEVVVAEPDSNRFRRNTYRSPKKNHRSDKKLPRNTPCYIPRCSRRIL